MRKTGLFSGLLLLMIIISGAAFAGSASDYLIFSQATKDQKVIYLYQPEDLTLYRVVQGKSPVVFLQGKYFLYFNEQQLFRYNVTNREAKLLASFKEKEVNLEVMPDGPEQALVVAKDDYEINWYILELSDGSLRRIKQPPFERGGSSDLKLYSPDREFMVIIKTPAFGANFAMTLEKKTNGKFKNFWSLPRELTLVPDWPIWSPDSKYLAFYGKEANGLEGFYSLYLLDLTTKNLKIVENQVFAKFIFSNMAMSSFTPDWSNDGGSLIYQTEPSGLPNRSSIVKYEIATGKKQVLTNSPGSNDYPSWSPSDRFISFLSNRETSTLQLYVMDGQGQNLKMVSPQEGYTEWAGWYKPD